MSSGTVLFFENFHVHLVWLHRTCGNGLSGQGRFSAVHVSVHVLMFGASLANGFATWCDVIAQSGCLSYGSLPANQRRQSAIRHRFVSCPSCGGQRNMICLPSGLMLRFRGMRSDCVNQRPSMASGLSFGSREGQSVLRQVAVAWQNLLQTMFVGMPRQGISHATVKHFARFRGLLVFNALAFVRQPNCRFNADAHTPHRSGYALWAPVNLALGISLRRSKCVQAWLQISANNPCATPSRAAVKWAACLPAVGELACHAGLGPRE
jgi:hypothetical protein